MGVQGCLLVRLGLCPPQTGFPIHAGGLSQRRVSPTLYPAHVPSRVSASPPSSALSLSCWKQKQVPSCLGPSALFLCLVPEHPTTQPSELTRGTLPLPVGAPGRPQVWALRGQGPKPVTGLG